MLQLIKSHPEQAVDFSRAIVSKANGVFLWYAIPLSNHPGILSDSDLTHELNSTREYLTPQRVFQDFADQFY